ncbi:hypothetical protein [Calothrix sp. CCY 0018]|uniref:hypothetical protein n=1 Tax=Calothrix sp. CCY 0018 TaxID=3103864 RepID=UPI0039C6DDD4
MRRSPLFLSRFILSLWIVLVSAFLFLLLSNAPGAVDTPFASISIKAESSIIHLPNRIFACTEAKQQFQCQAKIQARSLDLIWEKGRDYKYNLSNCRASYNGQSVGCQEKGINLAPKLSPIYEITNLGLSSQQYQAIRQKYWGINALMKLGESQLVLIGARLSLAAGVSAAFFTWLHPGALSKGFASIACGFGIYHLVWGFLGGVRFDVVTPYGFTPDTWIQVVNGTAIFAAILTIITTALLLWQRVNRLSKILFIIISSVGVFNLCLLSVSINFGTLSDFFGLAETFSQQRYALMWLVKAISVILAIAAAILLWLHTSQSIKKFLCLVSGFGTVAFAYHFSLFILLLLGYAD